MARSMIHGSEIYGGLNIPHAYFLQTIKFTSGPPSSARQNESADTNLYEQFTITCWLHIPFLHLSFSKYSKWISSSWLTSIWKCASRVDFQIHVQEAWNPSIQWRQWYNANGLLCSTKSLSNWNHLIDAINTCRFLPCLISPRQTALKLSFQYYKVISL